MKTKEETIRAAAEHAANGFLCSEAVLLALSESMGAESDFIPRIATGFAAGIARNGEACGALTGAIMALGLMYGRDTPETEPGRRPYWFSRRLAEEFRRIHGGVRCPEVLKLNIDDPEDYKIYSEKGMWETTCRDAIRAATGLAYDIISEGKE
ncbi:C_GCAxxG_C_C family protein [Candidatus Bathyarchaeota archaeon]|nr:C_GCAxxG_C_C family protein [Candidatus Bathyarchaeota archaeon]